MLPLVSAIFVASLLGSLHCAGMCGAFVALAVNGVGSNRPSRVATQAAYHGGRLITYATLGAIAGGLGSILNLAAALGGLQPVACAIAALSMIAFASVALLRINGVRVARLPIPRVMQDLLVRGHQLAMNRSPVVRAGLIGLLTTLLPCGWLYAFVITAAGTASPARGAVAMAVFWAGTLPVLVSIGTGAQALLGTFGKKLPTVTCLLVFAAGVYTLVGRSHLSAAAMARSLTDAAVTTASVAADRAEDGPAPTSAMPTTVPSPNLVPPCCRHE